MKSLRYMLLLAAALMLVACLSCSKKQAGPSAKLDIEPVSTTTAGLPVTIRVSVDQLSEKADDKVVSLELFYRKAGEADYASMSFSEKDGVYEASIPTDSSQAGALEYYIVGKLASGKTISVPAENPSLSPAKVTIQEKPVEAKPKRVAEQPVRPKPRPQPVTRKEPEPEPEPEIAMVAPGISQAYIDSLIASVSQIQPLDVDLSEKQIESQFMKPNQLVATGTQAKGFMVLSPRPDQELVADEYLVAISMNPSQTKINPANLMVMVDGVDRTSEATITNEVVVLPVKTTTSGNHNIVLQRKATSDSPARSVLNWSYTTKSKTSVKTEWTEVSGRAGVELIYQNVNDDLLRIARETAAIGARRGDWKFSARTTISSEENKRLQPQHRFHGSVQYKDVTLQLGDVNPMYNELVLWGRRTRGMEMAYNGQYFGAKAIYGEQRRAVDPRQYLAYYIDESDPNNPLLMADTSWTSGTYRRWMGAFRTYVQHPKYFTLGLTVMKAKDDESSIDYGTKPKDNLVAGMDFKAFADRRRVTLSAAVAMSLYNDDISDPVMDSYRQYQDLIYINQHFDPVLTDEAGDFGEALSTVLDRSLSFRTRLGLRYFNHNIQAEVYRINKSFKSIAMPSLAQDREGVRLRDRWRLFDSALHLKGGIDVFRDNVIGGNENTKTSMRFNLGFDIYSDPSLPNLSFNWQNDHISNDAEQRWIAQGDPDAPEDSLEIDDRKDYTENRYSGNLTYNRAMFGANNEFTLQVVQSMKEDKFNDLNQSDQQNYNLSFRSSFYDLPIISTVYYSRVNQQGQDGLTDIGYDAFNLRLQFNFMNNTLRPFVGPRLTHGVGTRNYSPYSPQELLEREGYDITDPTLAAQIDSLNLTTPKDLLLDFQRIDWIGGVEWEFMPNHLVRADVSMSAYTEANRVRYWNGAEFSSQSETVTNTDGTTTVTFAQPIPSFKRDDLTMMLRYTYKF